MRLGVGVIAGSVLALTTPALASEPWSDPDPPAPPERYEIGDVGVRAEAEYRVDLLYVNPISLNSEDNRRINWIDHRLRAGAVVDYEDKVKLTVSLDALDMVLWGDNGTLGQSPEPNSGINAAARSPNMAEPCIALLEGDPLQASSYGYSLCDATPVKIRRLFAQVTTPIGALRFGRQPVSVGMGVLGADGDGRRNRFGIAHGGDSVDRLMFATKPLEALKPEKERDLSETRGLILALLYDRWVSDSVRLFGDDVHQVGGAVRFLEPDDWADGAHDLEAQLFYVYRWDQQYATHIHTIGGRLASRFGDFWAGIDAVGNVGSTREVASAYSLITSDPIVDQRVLQFGGRAVVRYDHPLVTPYLEVDYASGDPNPESRTPLSQFRFAEDTNVGLLLFEHLLDFQSARAAAAGTEIVRRLGATAFPSERIRTRGAFTDALAVFPQLDVHPHESVLLRAGVLVAWAPEPVIDPVQSLQARDGLTIDDDLVNFVGGKPERYLGTELDARFQWRFLDHFALDLEGALLFPGPALEDANGDAVRAVLLQGRTTAFF
ncbi:MAG: hypothetical protein IT373_32030 [Polyangiaceae bacterium]|nr:hypothetical protein [Polyangiaceae bacterium]